MLHSVSNPALRDAIACCRRELGEARLGELLAVAGLEATEYALEDAPAAAGEAAEQASRRLWWAIWQTLAAMAPDSFAVNPAAVSSRSSDFYVHLHARRRYLPAMPSLELTADETTEIIRARWLLRQWTGLPTLTANEIRVVTEDCLPLRNMGALPDQNDILGWALGSEPVCRYQVVFHHRGCAPVSSGSTSSAPSCTKSSTTPSTPRPARPRSAAWA